MRVGLAEEFCTMDPREETAAPLVARSKLPDVGISIFAVMTQMADAHGAINLSQGFPDFDCDPELVETLARHMRAGRNQYAPMPGVPALRDALAVKFERLYGASYDPVTEITVTAGATEGIFSSITALTHPGDEVVVFEPCYDSYVPTIRLSGGTPVVITLGPPDYRIDWLEVRRALTPRTKLIILNSPHNPSGAIFERSDLDELAALLDGTSIVVISDEVYEHIVFDGARHESLARHPELRGRSLVVSSFGKTYHTTGWKVGYCVAPAPLSQELRRVHQFVTFAVNTPAQHAYAEFMKRRDGTEVTAFYQRKRDLFLSLIEGSRFRPLIARGTYFQLLDYSAISSEPDAPFAERVLKEHGVAAIPTSAFISRGEAPRVLRFCFAKRDETLEAAAERLRRI
jgi:methionine transaminase